jgi:hypothetical protein
VSTFVVVGGDAAGMSAASKAKRDNPDLDVVVFEQGEWVSYGACGLPYYIKGEIQSLEDLVSVTPEEFREVREYLIDRLDHFSGEMGLGYDGIEIRNQRTRWGSCSTNGTISLNWRLLMAPPEVIDYVVVHELAHLREPNHTDAFWSLVAEQIPEWETHADWLEEHSTRLVFSADDL